MGEAKATAAGAAAENRGHAGRRILRPVAVLRPAAGGYFP